MIPVMVTSQGFHLSPLNPLVAQRSKQRGEHRRPGTFFFAVGALLRAASGLLYSAQSPAVFQSPCVPKRGVAWLPLLQGRICGDRKPPANGTCLSEKRPDYSAFTRQRVGGWVRGSGAWWSRQLGRLH